MDTITIPTDEYQKMISLIESLKSMLERNKGRKGKHNLPVVWSDNPDITALFYLAEKDSKFDLSEIRKTWQRKN